MTRSKLSVLAFVVTVSILNGGCRAEQSTNKQSKNVGLSSLGDLYYSSVGDKQCEAPKQTSANLQQEVKKISASGISVTGSACGTQTDAGVISVCGAATLGLWLVAVEKGSSSATMASLKYDPVSSKIKISEVACK